MDRAGAVEDFSSTSVGPERSACGNSLGDIQYDQMIPLEDFNAGWGTDLEWWNNNSKPGVVGQEIYGAGGPIWYALWQDEIDE